MTPVRVAQVLVPSLAGGGAQGVALPQLATGIANGLCTWVAQVVVSTVDTGTLGVGTGGPLPVVLPSQFFQANMLVAFANFGLGGIAAPGLAAGLVGGLTLAFLEAFVVTTHPNVGVGAAVARFSGPPAGFYLAAGLASAGLLGQSAGPFGQAIGQALDTTFAGLVMPLSIAGSASPTAGGGTGVGKIA